MMITRFLLLAISISFAAHAAGTPVCGTATTAAETRTCLENEVAQAEAQLETYLSAAQAQTAQMTDKPPNLAHAQEVWLEYRKQHCGDAYLFWGAGSIRYEAATQCNLELTHARTHELWSAFLVRYGNSPPVLPEP